jgi:hypothetical protein
MQRCSHRFILAATRCKKVAEESRDIARESLQLSKEQALMRPDFHIEFYLDRRRFDEEYEDLELPESLAFLKVYLTNRGKTAATSVHGWLHMEAEKLGPYVPPPPPPRSREQWDHGLSEFLRSSMPPPKIDRSWGSIFDEDQQPEDGFYEAQVYEKGRWLPNVCRTFSIGVGVGSGDKAEIRYHIVSAEGAEIEGAVEISLSDGTEIQEDDAGEWDDPD